MFYFEKSWLPLPKTSKFVIKLKCIIWPKEILLNTWLATTDSNNIINDNNTKNSFPLSPNSIHSDWPSDKKTLCNLTDWLQLCFSMIRTQMLFVVSWVIPDLFLCPDEVFKKFKAREAKKRETNARIIHTSHVYFTALQYCFIKMVKTMA